MSGNPFLTRFEIESSREVEGQLLVSGRGLAGEVFEDLLLIQPHGAASRPPKGSIGIISTMPGYRTTSLVVGVEHNEKRPSIEDEDSVLYAHGSKLLIHADGATFDLADKTATFTGAGWTINGPVTINGNLSVSGTIQAGGNITSGGTITDADGDGGA